MRSSSLSPRVVAELLTSLSAPEGEVALEFPGYGTVHLVRTSFGDDQIVVGRNRSPFADDEIELIAAIAGLLERTVAVAAAHGAQGNDAAERDTLTSLPTGATIRAELTRRLGGADHQPTSLLVVDLERHTTDTETELDETGLVVVADRLRTTVREGDLVGRLPGGEFVVACEGIGAIGAVEFAERLQAAISRPVTVDDGSVVVTASIGIAEARSGERADDLLADAVLALSRAKEAGPARIDVVDDSLRPQVADRLSIGQGMQQAIDNDEFAIQLQPLVELATRRVTGFEALVRWNHPSRGLLAPASFLPAAEHLGFIAAIDRIVLARTIGLLGRHHGARPIAVNLSAATLADPGLIGWLTTTLAQHEVGPSRLLVEVTENVVMDQRGSVARQLHALRDLGIGVVLDDVGAGSSPLAAVESFGVDGVKIDRSVVARLADDPRAETTVTAVFAQAESLHLGVVAEGIETDGQADHLMRIAEDFPTVPFTAQGYLFGRPADAETRLAGFVEVPRELLVG